MLVSELGPLIPHAGRMRLLHDVRQWDDTRIECRATSHRDPGNPLRIGDALPALVGVEYGAQAMAIHGALVGAGGPVSVGMLVAAHDVICPVERLDDIASDLVVTATRVLGSARQVVYEFALAADGRELVRGRASVMLSVDTPDRSGAS